MLFIMEVGEFVRKFGDYVIFFCGCGNGGVFVFV